MKQYQLIGLGILGIALIIAGLTFWPITGTPPQNVPDIPLSEGDQNTTTKTPAKTPVAAPTRTFENGFYVNTIIYTDTGFSPSFAEIKKGEEVRFVNRSNTPMQIIAQETSSSLYYRAINQGKLVPKGGQYQLGLPELGVFDFYSLNSTPRKVGKIIVK